MEAKKDLAIILKHYPFQERDRIVICLTERHGKFTALAKGAVQSRRFGGALNTFSCSQILFSQKPSAELGRIDEATIHYEFQDLHKDFEKLAAASVVSELCLKLLEPHVVSRDVFVLVSNVLFALNGKMMPLLAVVAFLSKLLRILGYPPSFLRCVQCGKAAHEIMNAQIESSTPLFFWVSEAGGMACYKCVGHHNRRVLEDDVLLVFNQITLLTFKELGVATFPEKILQEIYVLLSDFLSHHVPGLAGGSAMKSLKFFENPMNSI